ncbi:endothelin-converting enzyme, metalloprotease family M13 [Achlya hypogyna]|uniref:Endothelin-converting enzyme, metalloprotease family M13 n=1 Tax=Achlya hypogyna TaxID=1202772 RepID=A0A0A7CNK7_ACHHY|nr:secreted protein [Achlya hypogyna]OQR91056.1 endothelin-converting enzyme, metalloprotease family M13 [Achlya hypogyna]
MVKIIASVSALAATALAGNVAEFPKEVSSLMDQTVDPCTNFYEYACGGWYKNVVIPADRATVDTSFSVLGNKNDAVIRQIIDAKYPKLREYYESCTDEATLTSLGLAPIAEDMQSLRTNSTTSLLRAAAELSKKGVPAFTELQVFPDNDDATTNVLYTSQVAMTLEHEYYVTPEKWDRVRPSYEAYLIALFTAAGNTDPAAAAKVVMDFELTLAGVQLSKLEMLEAKTSKYNPMSYAEAATKFPLSVGIQLQAYGFNIHDSCIDATNKVILYDLDFFDRMEALLKKQSVSTLQTVMEFAVLHTNAPYLTPALATANWNLFGKAIRGQKMEPSREKKCTADIQKVLGELVSDYFVKATFSKEAATRADEMVLALEASFKQGIQNATWLDEDTRKNGLTKLSKFVHLIGAPENPQKYPTLALDSKTYVDNRNKVKEFDLAANLALLGTKVDRHKWSSPASEVNAWYDPSLNSITFPAGILQSPFFDGSFDASQNFGAIGMVIGHEITHGFDNSGRNYDGDGNVNDWWSDETSLEFNKKAKCIVDQYGAFDVKSEITGKSLGFVDGRLTLGETIADNGGLKTAFRAYREYTRTSPSKFTQETADKVFFLSFAQGWCSKNTDKYLELILEDEHPPGKFRVFGAVQNNDAFAKAFNCPANSAMNPTKKCYLWE